MRWILARNTGAVGEEKAEEKVFKWEKNFYGNCLSFFILLNSAKLFCPLSYTQHFSWFILCRWLLFWVQIVEKEYFIWSYFFKFYCALSHLYMFN